ncbi:MAG: hypothetical protein HY673_05390 [Chloroflexi bacterium]|nr:hypothetical protein [Chloroflexota bacterium]
MVKNILAGIGVLAIVIFIALAIGVFVVVPRLLKAEPFTLKPDTSYSREGVVVSLVVTEGDINAKLAENPQIAEAVGRALAGTPVGEVKTRNLRVKLERDRLTAAIDADIWKDGTWVTGTLSGKVFLAGGKPAVELDRITIGVLPFPASLMPRVNSELNGRIQAMDLKLPVDLREIRIDDGKITGIATVDMRTLQMPAGVMGR